MTYIVSSGALNSTHSLTRLPSEVTSETFHTGLETFLFTKSYHFCVYTLSIVDLAVF